MTSLPVICVITSASCGHCNKMRNSGDISTSECVSATIPGGNCWNESFFKALISDSTGTPKFRVYEIHFGPMNFGIEEFYNKIVEFNEYVWTGTKTQRNKYRSEYTRTPEAKCPENPEGNLRVVSIVNGHQLFGTLAFTDFLAKRIPNQIHNYVQQYPSWMFSEGTNWDSSIKNGTPLISHVFGFKTISPGKIEPFGSEKPESILSFSRRFLGGEVENTSAPSSEQIEEQCLRQGYVKSKDFVIMKTGTLCEKLGFRIKLPPP